MTDRRPTLTGVLEPFVEELAQRVADVVVERLTHSQSANPTPPLLSKGQLATALGVSVASVDRYLRRSVISPTVRLGADGPVRFDLSEVRGALERANTDEQQRPPLTVDAPPKLLTRRSR